MPQLSGAHSKRAAALRARRGLAPRLLTARPLVQAEFRHGDRLRLLIEFSAGLRATQEQTPAPRHSPPSPSGGSPAEVPQSPAPTARLRAAQAEAQALRAELGDVQAKAAEAGAARVTAERQLADARAQLQRAEAAKLRALSTTEALRLDLLSERAARADDGRRFDAERRSLEQLCSIGGGDAGGLEELQQMMVRSIRGILREENADVERIVRTLCATTHAKQKKQTELLAQAEQEAAASLRVQADETRRAIARAAKAERALNALQHAQAASRGAEPASGGDSPPPPLARFAQPAAAAAPPPPPRHTPPGPLDRRAVPMVSTLAPIGWGAGSRAGASSFISSTARPREEGTFIRSGADGRGGTRKVFLPLESNAACAQLAASAAEDGPAAAKKARRPAGGGPLDQFFSR